MLKCSSLYIAKNVFIIFIDPVIAAFCSLLMVLLHLSMFNFFKCSGRDFGTAPSAPMMTGTIWCEYMYVCMYVCMGFKTTKTQLRAAGVCMYVCQIAQVVEHQTADLWVAGLSFTSGKKCKSC